MKVAVRIEMCPSKRDNIRMVSLWLVAIGFACGLTNVVAAESNLLYKEYWFRTEQLCPDLQEAIAGKDIDTANLPYKSVFRFIDHLQTLSDAYAYIPCILEANGPQRLPSMAVIEAVHLDTRPWNFSLAQTCEEHIKLRLPEPTFLKRSSDPKIICKIPRSKVKSNHSKDSTGSMFHPYVWQFQKGKLGLSLSSFNLSHVANTLNKNSSGTTTASDINSMWNSSHQDQDKEQEKNYWLEPDSKGYRFVQIVFTTHLAGACSVRVQQYLVDEEKTLCEGVKQHSPFRLCGLYDCSEKQSILRTLGFWTHRKESEQLDMLFQSEIPLWRKEPSYLEILVSTLRALIMPLLFISVFYVTRRLRLKLASRQATAARTVGLDRHRSVLRQRQCYLRALGRNGSQNNSASDNASDSALRPSLIQNHIVYDIPVGDVYEDLPPPYESIVQPPSYASLDALQVKPTPSPVDNQPCAYESHNTTQDNTVSEATSSHHDSTDEEMVRLISSSSNPTPQIVSQQSLMSNSQSSA